jgi:hypothetical protein
MSAYSNLSMTSAHWKKIRLPVAILLALLFVVSISYFKSAPSLAAQNTEFIRQMNECSAHEKAGHGELVEPCYRRVAKVALGSLSAHDFLALILSQEKTSMLQKRCHQIEHVVAMETYKRVRSLEDTIQQCQIGGCGNGCVHGALAAHVQASIGGEHDGFEFAHADVPQLKQLAKRFCADDGAFCHGMGHLLQLGVQSTRGALAACKQSAPQKMLVDCYAGVFMEAAQSYGAFSFESPKVGGVLHRGKPYDCEQFFGLEQRICFIHFPGHARMVAAEQRQVQSGSARPLIDQCKQVRESDARASCHFGFGFTEGIQEMCDRIADTQDQLHCSVGVGIYYKKPLKDRRAFCEQLDGQLAQQACRDRVREMYSAPTKGVIE